MGTKLENTIDKRALIQCCPRCDFDSNGFAPNEIQHAFFDIFEDDKDGFRFDAISFDGLIVKRSA